MHCVEGIIYMGMGSGRWDDNYFGHSVPQKFEYFHTMKIVISNFHELT